MFRYAVSRGWGRPVCGRSFSLILAATALSLCTVAAGVARATVQATVPDGWRSAYNSTNSMLIAQPPSGATTALFVGLKAASETLDSASLRDFVRGVTNTDVTLERETPLRDGAIYQFHSGDGALRAKAMLKARGEETAFAVLITGDASISDADALGMVGRTVRSASRPSMRPSSGAAPGTKAAGMALATDAQLYVGVRFRPSATAAGGSGITRYNLLLLPDGTAYAGIPPGGELNSTPAELQALAPARLGSWRAQGANIVVDWPQRTGAYAREVYERDGRRLRLRGTPLAPVSCPSGPVNLAGTYKASTSRAVGTALGVPVQGALYGVRTLRFSRDGGIAVAAESAVAGRTAAGGGAGTAGSAADGRYRWSGCELVMTIDGEKSVHTGFFWPGEGESLLVVDGRTYIRQ